MEVRVVVKCLVLILCVVGLTALSSCAKNPAAKDDRIYQVGEASWYGGQFHGRTTASGERFDKNALTAAHATLPFGTRVRVTNRSDGRSVIVRINDRFPGTKGRVIDLSEGSFRQIAPLTAGVIPVTLVLLE